MKDDLVENRGGGGGIEDPRVRAGQLAALLPRDFKAEPGGSVVRLRIIDRDRLANRSGTVRYVFSHARDVDISSESTRRAGHSRSEFCGEIFAPGEEGREATCSISDARYATGTFFCVAVDAQGRASFDFLWSQIQSSQILDERVPDDVTRFSVSESGFEVAPGVMVSELSIAAYAPQNLGSFAGLQIWLKDYASVGSLQEGEYEQFNGQPGGRIDFKARYSPYRRGTGTSITVTNGSANVTGVATKFVSEVKAGDLLEVLNVRGTVLSVTDDTHLTLTGNWSGDTNTVDDFVILPLVTIYGVAISKAGTHRADVTNSPSDQELFDALLSAPNAPDVELSEGGNVIRAAVTATGTKLDRVILYRATGAGASFASSEAIKAWPADKVNLDSTLHYEDTVFTLFEREQRQTFTYFATAVNVRGDESLPSVAEEASCRLDSPAEGSPPNSAREIALNYLWNGHINGTDLASVDVSDAGQDVNMGGGTPPAGWYRAQGFAGGGGSAPGHVNGNEVVLAMTGVPNTGVTGSSFVVWRVDACDNATAANRRIATWKSWVLQVKARTSGGQPNGWLTLYIEMFDGAGVSLGFAVVKTRLSSDAPDFTDASVTVIGSEIMTDHFVYHGIFILDPTLTIAYINVVAGYSTINWNGVNIFITEAMLSPGENLPQWTAQMPDPDITCGKVTGGADAPPPLFTDQDGGFRPYVDIYMP